MPSHLAGTLRSHAWMNAAEGALYRKAVLAVAAEFGWTVRTVEQSMLPAERTLRTLGQAAGRLDVVSKRMHTLRPHAADNGRR